MTKTQEQFRFVKRAELYESPLNQRRTFDPVALEELAASIRVSGVVEALVARRNPNGKGEYEIASGHRRLRAAALAGVEELPVRVLELDDVAFVEILTISNLQRTDLHPMDEAEGYRTLMTKAGYDVAKIAARVGRSAQYVYDRLRFLQLTKPAQKLFRENRFTPAHATLISRCHPEQQAQIIEAEDSDEWGRERSPLWRDEGGHQIGFDDEAARRKDPYHGLQTRSVAELRQWIDDHVRFDPTAADVPVLFPETAQAVQQAAEQDLKVVKISYDHMLQPEAKAEGERTYGARSWKRADGETDVEGDRSQACGFARLGVVVAGPSRGDSFLVCVDKKKCDVHWKRERQDSAREAKARAGSTSDGYVAQQRREQEKQAAEQKRWEQARPKIQAAIEARIAALEVKPGGPVARLLIKAVSWNGVKGSGEVKTLDQLVRLLARHIVAEALRQTYSASRTWPELGKAFGVDVAAIRDAVAPAEKPAPEKAAKQKPTPKAKATAKKKKKGGR